METYKNRTVLRGRRRPLEVAKPPFVIPSMEEIAAIKPNGFKAVSTFSGCGGSCLGLRLAGFDVLWASEFVEAARETYSRNHRTPVDPRDIREVSAEDILSATGLKVGELDLLEGSPPCAAFSLAGKREKKWGEVSKYSDTEQRSDDLFLEYARLVEGLQPKVFAAENVRGLTVGKAKGFFIEIMERLERAGYVVEAQVLDAQWLGVPQRRQRVIIQGVRNDLGLRPAFPKPLPYRYSLREVLNISIRFPRDASSGLTECRTRTDDDLPAPTVSAAGMSMFGPDQVEVLDPITAVRAGGKVVELDEPAPTVLTHGRRATQSELVAVTDISNYAIGREAKNLEPGEQSDRYINLVRAHPDEPCPTVTQLGGANPGVASVIHPDGTRKFTISELKRICSFPDDFELTGTYAQQWERLGRAVPPLMMRAVAGAIRDDVLRRIAESPGAQ